MSSAKIREIYYPTSFHVQIPILLATQKMQETLSSSFEGFYDKIKEILESARNRSYRAVNFEMVQA